MPPRAVRGCPPRLPCRARAPSPSTCSSQPGDACSSRRFSTPNQAEPTAAKPPMRTPCSPCRSSAPDASWSSQITPPLPAVSWRTSRASSESMPKNRSSPKTTIHVLKPGRIARRGAANISTGKIPVIRPSRRSVGSAKSHPVRLSCSIMARGLAESIGRLTSLRPCAPGAARSSAQAQSAKGSRIELLTERSQRPHAANRSSTRQGDCIHMYTNTYTAMSSRVINVSFTGYVCVCIYRPS